MQSEHNFVSIFLKLLYRLLKDMKSHVSSANWKRAGKFECEILYWTYVSCGGKVRGDEGRQP
jgi:hypothetical protein